MAHPHPTTTWEAMQDGNTFYSKQQIYMMQWQGLYDLSDYIIAVASHGGPIAMMRDTSKIAVVSPTATALGKAEVRIWSASGEALLLFKWDTSVSRIIEMGWTSSERLVLLNEEGFYRLYDLQGGYEQYSLGSEVAEVGVIQARIHEEGIVALVGAEHGSINGQIGFVEVRGWNGGRPVKFADTGLADAPSTWTIIPPASSPSAHTLALISPSPNSSTPSTILSMDTLECTDQRISLGPFSYLVPSPNGKYLAMLTLTGTLIVISHDFGTRLADFDTTVLVGAEDGGGFVRQVAWCGNDAVFVGMQSGMGVLVGPGGDTLFYPAPSPTHISSEPDGLRILLPSTYSFLRKVHHSTLSIFRPGSVHPSATLFDAYELLEGGEKDKWVKGRAKKCEEKLRSVRGKGEMAAAVDGLIDAASREWEPWWQKRLLEAAKMGRSYLDLWNPTDFVNVGKALRVLNAVRYYEVGIPISYAEYILNSPENLISRLTSRHLHLLAFRISQDLGLRTDAVLEHWACAKVMKSVSSSGGGITASGDRRVDETDKDICESIVKKFQENGGGRKGDGRVDGSGVSYAEVARRAWEVGRSTLAAMLLDYEPRAANQVPLLLKMKQDKVALLKAVDSGDTDLVYLVLLNLYYRLSLGSFFKLLDEGGTQLIPARKLLEVYAKEQNKDMLRDFYYSDDRRVESAVLCLEEAKKMTDVNAQIESVKVAQKFFNDDRDSSFEAKMTDEHARLLTLQRQFEKEDKTIAFVGKSVNETIKTCLLNGMTKRADKVRGEFKVSDKRFWYIKLHTLTQMKDWVGLETLARGKKSPIGYEPFVHHLVEKGHRKEACTFVPRCDAKRRADLYVQCGEWRLAGQECKDRNDKAKLEQLRRTCPNSLIQRELEQIASSMGK